MWEGDERITPLDFMFPKPWLVVFFFFCLSVSLSEAGSLVVQAGLELAM